MRTVLLIVALLLAATTPPCSRDPSPGPANSSPGPSPGPGPSPRPDPEHSSPEKSSPGPSPGPETLSPQNFSPENSRSGDSSPGPENTRPAEDASPEDSTPGPGSSPGPKNSSPDDSSPGDSSPDDLSRPGDSSPGPGSSPKNSSPGPGPGSPVAPTGPAGPTGSTAKGPGPGPGSGADANAFVNDACEVDSKDAGNGDACAVENIHMVFTSCRYDVSIGPGLNTFSQELLHILNLFFNTADGDYHHTVRIYEVKAGRSNEAIVDFGVVQPLTGGASPNAVAQFLSLSTAIIHTYGPAFLAKWCGSSTGSSTVTINASVYQASRLAAPNSKDDARQEAEDRNAAGLFDGSDASITKLQGYYDDYLGSNGKTRPSAVDDDERQFASYSENFQRIQEVNLQTDNLTYYLAPNTYMEINWTEFGKKVLIENLEEAVLIFDQAPPPPPLLFPPPPPLFSPPPQPPPSPPPGKKKLRQGRHLSLSSSASVSSSASASLSSASSLKSETRSLRQQQQQQQRKLLIVSSPPPPPPLPSPPPPNPPPDAFTWTDAKNVVPAVRGQGVCGACWSFAALSAVSSAYALTTGNAAPVLAPQQLLDCVTAELGFTNSMGCQGGSPAKAMSYISSYGSVLEKVYPYLELEDFCSSPYEDPTTPGDLPALKLGSQGYTSVTKFSKSALMEAVLQQPVVITFRVESNFRYYAGGVFQSSTCSTSTNHVLLLVGYNSTAEIPYWIVQNTWGATWGLNGYAWLAIKEDGMGLCGMYKYNWSPSLTGLSVFGSFEGTARRRR